jgi:hypothetical protein
MIDGWPRLSTNLNATDPGGRVRLRVVIRWIVEPPSSRADLTGLAETLDLNPQIAVRSAGMDCTYSWSRQRAGSVS